MVIIKEKIKQIKIARLLNKFGFIKNGSSWTKIFGDVTSYYSVIGLIIVGDCYKAIYQSKPFHTSYEEHDVYTPYKPLEGEHLDDFIIRIHKEMNLKLDGYD